MERELKRVKGGRLFLIPGSEDTSGHATVFFAKFWKQQVQEFLETAPRGSIPGPRSAMHESKAA
jgi:homoserine O-acetyltransferase/O-succinyltransferase